jgi:hypothetical protein
MASPCLVAVSNRLDDTRLGTDRRNELSSGLAATGGPRRLAATDGDRERRGRHDHQVRQPLRGHVDMDDCGPSEVMPVFARRAS